MRLFLKKNNTDTILSSWEWKMIRVRNLFIKWHRNFSLHEFIHINERRYIAFTHINLSYWEMNQ
jgi:hypothetical protein